MIILKYPIQATERLLEPAQKITRVRGNQAGISKPVSTLFLFSSLVSLLFHAVLEKCTPHGDLNDILVSCS